MKTSRAYTDRTFLETDSESGISFFYSKLFCRRRNPSSVYISNSTQQLENFLIFLLDSNRERVFELRRYIWKRNRRIRCLFCHFKGHSCQILAFFWTSMGLEALKTTSELFFHSMASRRCRSLSSETDSLSSYLLRFSILFFFRFLSLIVFLSFL